MNPNFRIGYGEDAHRLEAGRLLVIAGITVPDSPVGAIAHSDGDVVLHTLSDALLSSLALGDIGKFFPDTAAEYKDMDSSIILQAALEKVQSLGWEIVNLAVVVTLDKPKLGALRDEMAANLSKLLKLAPENVGIGFKTSEGLSPNHIQARATVLLEKRLEDPR
jgi:2-C-methyl-D-erythritol 2,4-cyclodiphosphate synthase